MGAIASQVTGLTIVYSTVYSDADQRKHQSSASLAFVWGIHRGPVNSPHKWPVTRKMFPFDDVIMCYIFSSYWISVGHWVPGRSWSHLHGHRWTTSNDTIILAVLVKYKISCPLRNLINVTCHGQRRTSIIYHVENSDRTIKIDLNKCEPFGFNLDSCGEFNHLIHFNEKISKLNDFLLRNCTSSSAISRPFFQELR